MRGRFVLFVLAMMPLFPLGCFLGEGESITIGDGEGNSTTISGGVEVTDN